MALNATWVGSYSAYYESWGSLITNTTYLSKSSLGRYIAITSQHKSNEDDNNFIMTNGDDTDATI